MNTNCHKLKYTEVLLYTHIILAEKIKDKDRELKWQGLTVVIHANCGYCPLGFAKEPRKFKLKTPILIPMAKYHLVGLV